MRNSLGFCGQKCRVEYKTFLFLQEDFDTFCAGTTSERSVNRPEKGWSTFFFFLLQQKWLIGIRLIQFSLAWSLISSLMFSVQFSVCSSLQSSLWYLEEHEQRDSVFPFFHSFLLCWSKYNLEATSALVVTISWQIIFFLLFQKQTRKLQKLESCDQEN